MFILSHIFGLTSDQIVPHNEKVLLKDSCDWSLFLRSISSKYSWQLRLVDCKSTSCNFSEYSIINSTSFVFILIQWILMFLRIFNWLWLLTIYFPPRKNTEKLFKYIQRIPLFPNQNILSSYYCQSCAIWGEFLNTEDHVIQANRSQFFGNLKDICISKLMPQFKVFTLQ